MPIDPTVGTNLGTLEGSVTLARDLMRRVAALEHAAGVLSFNSVTGAVITPGAIDASHIVAGAIQAGHIEAGAITTDAMFAGTIDADRLLAGSITSDLLYAGTIEADLIQAANIAVGAIQAGHIEADSIYGYHVRARELEAEHIKADTITANELRTGFLDANVSNQAYIESEAIKGGELSLGGIASYSQKFVGDDGDLWRPWVLSQTTSGQYDATWTDDKLRVAVKPSTVYGVGDYARFSYSRPNATNLITKTSFHIKVDLPADFIMELVDETGAVINTYTQSGTYETAGGPLAKETQTLSKAAVGFQLRRINSGITTGSSITAYIEVSTVDFSFLRGYGNLNIFDSEGNLRAEMTADYISYKNADGDVTFNADDDGVWVPADHFAIGSTNIADLRYLLRDLSGNLCINPRFENLKSIARPAEYYVPAEASTLAQIPSDWTYLYDSGAVSTRSEDYISFKDVLPQRQSLVSGRVLRMSMQPTWDNTKVVRAVSHKRYVDADTNTPQMPLAMSAFFRVVTSATNTADKNKIKVRAQLYASPSPSDITTSAEIAADTLLGSASLTGAAVTDATVDGNVFFERLAHSYRLATGGAGDQMILTNEQGTYIYVVLSAWCDTSTLSDTTWVEWDNIDLSIAEENTPSDSQPMAELARRQGDVAVMFTNIFSRTKCILPELATGNKGLTMTAVW